MHGGGHLHGGVGEVVGVGGAAFVHGDGLLRGAVAGDGDIALGQGCHAPAFAFAGTPDVPAPQLELVGPGVYQRILDAGCPVPRNVLEERIEPQPQRQHPEGGRRLRR